MRGGIQLIVRGCFGLHELIQHVRFQAACSLTIQHSQTGLTVFVRGQGAGAVACPLRPFFSLFVVLVNGELRALQRHAGVAVLLAQHELCGGGRCIRLDLVGDAAVAGFAAVAQGHGVAHLVAGGSTAILHIAVIHKDHGRHIGDLHMEPAVLVRFQDAVHVARHLFAGGHADCFVVIVKIQLDRVDIAGGDGTIGGADVIPQLDLLRSGLPGRQILAGRVDDHLIVQLPVVAGVLPAGLFHLLHIAGDGGGGGLGQIAPSGGVGVGQLAHRGVLPAGIVAHAHFVLDADAVFLLPRLVVVADFNGEPPGSFVILCRRPVYFFILDLYKVALIQRDLDIIHLEADVFRQGVGNRDFVPIVGGGLQHQLVVEVVAAEVAQLEAVAAGQITGLVAAALCGHALFKLLVAAVGIGVRGLAAHAVDMDGVLIGPHLTGGHVVALLVGGDAGHRDAAHGVLVVPGFHMDGKAAHTGGRVICVYLCCAVSVGVVGHLDGVASLRIGQLRVVVHGQGQIGLDGVIQLFCNGIVGVLFCLALVVLSVVQHIPQGKLRFTGLVGGREVPGGRLAPGGNGFAQAPIALLQGDRIAGREGFAVLGGSGGIGHVAAADGGGGAEGDLQLVPAIHISGRDGVAFAVVPEFLRADLFPADVYFAHDLYARRQIILDHIAHKEVAGDERTGHTDRDLPFDLAIPRLVLALLGDARLLHGHRLKVAGILQPLYIGLRTVDDDAGAVFRVVEGSAVEQYRVAPEILFACIQGREVGERCLPGISTQGQGIIQKLRHLRQVACGIHPVKNKAVCNISAQQLIHLAISFAQGIGDGHRIFGAIRGLNADHIVHLEGAIGQILHQWLPDARIAAVAVICRAELVEDHIRFFRLDGQGAVVLEGELLLVLKVVGARRNGGLEGTDEFQAGLVVGADELFVRKGQGHFAVGVNGEAAHDLCIAGLVLVGLIHDVARRHIRHGQAFGQLVGQGIVGGRQHTGIHGILQVHADVGAAVHGHAARADRRPCFSVGRLFIIDIRDPGVQIMVVPGSQQGDAVGVGVTHPVHGGTKGALIFQQRIAAVQLLLGACRVRVLRGHSGGLGGIGPGHRDDTGHVGHGSGHLGHLAVHVAGDHGQGPGVGVHGGHDAHRLGGHGAGVHLRLGSRELGGGVGVLVQVQQGDAIGALVHGHLLGGEGVVDDDIAGPCGGAVGVGEPLGAAQVTVQGHHARTLGHHRLGHTRKVQAVGQEHHVPGAVGVAVPGTIAGVAAQHLLVLHIQLEVLVALLVVQLGLCHGEQVLGPVAVQGHVGRGLPFLGSLHVGLGIGQALHGVVVLRDGAHQLLGVAGVGVVMQHRLVRGGLGRLSGQVHHGAAGRHFLIGGVGLLHQFAFVQAAHQLILGGVAAVVVDMLELAADERTVLVKAVVGVLVLFLIAGQHPVLLVAGIGVLMGHPDGLRLGLHRLFRLFRAVGRHRIGAAVRRGDGRFRLALLVTAGEHFFVAGRRVLVLLVAAVVVGSHGDAHPMELPVDEQGGEQGQHQHQGHIAPGLYMLPAEPLDQPVDDILHSKHVLLVRSVPWQPHTAAGPQKGPFIICATKASQKFSTHCHYTILGHSFQLRGVLFRQKNAHDAHHARGQGQPQHRAAQIEQGVGVGDLPGQHGALRPVGRDQPHQRGELGQQQPAHRRPGQVEQGVGRRQTFGVPALPHRCQHRRDGGADVVPQQHRDGTRKAQQAPAVRPGAGGRPLQHRNGGGAALHGKGHAKPCQQAQAGAVPHLGHPLPEHRPRCQRLHGLGHDRDALKQQAESKQRLPGCVQTPAPREPEQQPRHQQQIPGILQPEGQQLRGDRGADVGSEHHRHGPLQGQQPGPHKAQHQHRDRRAALHHRRDRRPREHPGQRVGREPGKGLPQGVPRRLLQSVREGVHTV